jgi:hypothetical protein
VCTGLVCFLFQESVPSLELLVLTLEIPDHFEGTFIIFDSLPGDVTFQPMKKGAFRRFQREIANDLIFPARICQREL